MVNVTSILEAIQARLSNDATLTAALGTKPESSKVLIQVIPPLEAAQFPLLLISDFAMTAIRAGQRSKNYDAAIDFSLYCAPKANGSPDWDLIYSVTAAVDNSIRFEDDRGFRYESGGVTAVSFELFNSAAVEVLDPAVVRKVLTYQCKVSGA